MSFYIDSIDTLRHAGRLERAWRLGYRELVKTPDDTMIKRALFSVMIAYIRQYNQVILEKYENRLRRGEEYEELKQIAYVVEKVLELCMPFGGDEYSTLLKECERTLEFMPKLVNFIIQYRHVIFTADDAKLQRTEKGKSLSSLMYKVTMSILRYYEHQRMSELIPFAQLNELVEQTRQNIQDKKPRIWLEYNFVKCLIKAGKIQEARVIIGHYLATHWRVYYFWALLGDTYQDEPLKAVECYMTGLRFNSSAQFAKHAVVRLPGLLKQIGEDRAARLFAEKESWLFSHWPASSKEEFVRENRCQVWINQYSENYDRYLRLDHRVSHGLISHINERGNFCLIEGIDLPFHRSVSRKLFINADDIQLEEGMRVRFRWIGDLENFVLIDIYLEKKKRR